jgi:hypothetical protein
MTSRKPAAGTGTGARTETMRKGRQADSARRRQRVLTALDRAAASRTEISASGIARAAGVDRTFLYRHPDLLEKNHAAEAAPPPAGGTAGPAVSRASLQADLLAAHERAIRLAARLGRTGAPCRDCSRWVSPARPPHPTCTSPRIGRSTCLAR